MSSRRGSVRLRGVRKRLLRTDNGIRIYLVDGERIRDFVNIDFVAGSNHGRNKFVPRNEVWVEQILSKHDREATIIHELHERGLMLKGMGYEPAHDRACIVEGKYRRSTRR